jgi:hypothetical protein
MRELLGRAHLRPTKIDLLSKQHRCEVYTEHVRRGDSSARVGTFSLGICLSSYVCLSLRLSLHLSVCVSLAPLCQSLQISQH